MKTSDRILLLGAIFSAVMSIMYSCVMYFGITVPRYYPLEHTWKWVNEKGVPSQGWYGLQLYAFLAGGVVTLVAYLFLKRMNSNGTSLQPGLSKLIGVFATLVVVLSMVYVLYHEFHKWGIISS